MFSVPKAASLSHRIPEFLLPAIGFYAGSLPHWRKYRSQIFRCISCHYL